MTTPAARISSISDMSLSRSTVIAATAASIVTAAVMAVVPQPAGASTRPAGPVLVSGADPLPGYPDPRACASGRGMPYDRHDWESEPTLAVDPADSNHLVSAWSQDWLDGIVVGTSFDGGSTWSSVVPPTSTCTPGGTAPYDSGATDAGLAFGRTLTGASVLYLTSSVSGTDGSVGIVVNRSFDGGRTWRAGDRRTLEAVPGALVTRASGLDAPSVLADPNVPGRAYATWAKADPLQALRRQQVAVTTDGGQTWTAGRAVPGEQPAFYGRLAVASDGALVDVLAETISVTPDSSCPPPLTVSARRSTDLGATWSSAATIGPSDTGVSAVGRGPDGTLYVSWKQAGASSHAVQLGISSDGGRSWVSSPVGAGVAGPVQTSTVSSSCAFPAIPDLAVRSDGTVAVAFMDHRRDPGGTPARVTDAWLRTSSDHGSSWTETHVAGPFDQTQAPSLDCVSGTACGTAAGEGNGFLGDYQGLVAAGDTFALADALTGPLAGAGFSLGTAPTDIFFTRVRTGRARSAS